jgi:hypothetical protein
MPSLRIVLDPEAEGLGIEYEGELIHLGDDAEIVISGLADGMQSGKPSMVFAFKLPNGDLVAAETSWRLFGTAYNAFLGKFGEPDYPGLRIEMPTEGRAIELVKSDEPFVQCGRCGWRLDGSNTKESVEHLMREYERHYRKKHRGVPPPPPFPGRN